MFLLFLYPPFAFPLQRHPAQRMRRESQFPQQVLIDANYGAAQTPAEKDEQRKREEEARTQASRSKAVGLAEKAAAVLERKRAKKAALEGPQFAAEMDAPGASLIAKEAEDETRERRRVQN